MKAIFNGMGAPLGEGTGLRLLLAVLLLGAPVILQAQTVMGSISGQVVQPPPPVGTGGVAAGAAVRVCNYDGSTGTPCNPLTTNVYIDPPGTIPALNPSTADQYGNYSLWVPQLAHGYIVQVTPINGITYSYSVMAVGGTVTSVAMTAPPIFAVGGSPITSSGTLALTLVTQSGNLVWASPVGGGIPIFRSILPADHASQSANTVLGNCTGVTAVPTACALIPNMVPSTLNATNFSGNVGVTGTLSTTAAATLASLIVTGNGLVGGTFGAVGATSLSSTLSVTGASTLLGTLNVTGAATLASTLSVGAVTSSGTVGAANVNTTGAYLVNGAIGTNTQCLISNGTLSIYSGCPLNVVSPNGTPTGNPSKNVRFIAPLVAGTYTQALNFGGAFPFGSIIYCYGNDLTAVNPVSVVAASVNSIVTTGTGSDQIQVTCIGG